MAAFPVTVESLRERIEAVVPEERRAEEYRTRRKDEIYRPLEETDRDTERFVLHAIVQAHALFFSEKAKQRIEQRELSEDEYRKKSATLRRRLESCRADPLLKWLDYELYEFREAACPHGRLRRECEALFEKRQTLQLLAAPPFGTRYPKRVVRLKRQHRDVLQRKPSDFCRPNVLPVLPLPAPKAGARPAFGLNFLVSSVIGYLVTAPRRWTVAASAALVASVFSLCFGLRANPESIATQWRRLQRQSEARPSR